ncbi:MAG TPA: amino acid racemase [Pyrinomonadaceae bacterium]|jgi:aspartate racemase
MKTVGIIGGTGPEATVDYYQQIIASYRAQAQDDSYPQIIINSINLKTMVSLLEANDLKGLTNFLLVEVRKLAHAGASFGLLSANTPHIVFDELNAQSPIPLISIVEATCEAAARLQLKRLGLFGTRFTMEGRFYKEVFSRKGMTLVLPDGEERAYIHDKYVNELVLGNFLPETRERLLTIAERLREQDGIEALILGGTELPLILRDDADRKIPFLDTTRIHVAAIVAQLLS